MNSELIRRFVGLIILVSTSLFIAAVGIERAGFVRFVWALGFVLMLV